MSNKKSIGIVGYWGFGRGQSYWNLCHAKMMIPEYDVHILKQGNNQIADEYKIGVNVTEYPQYFIDTEFFKKWVIENKLDAVMFSEYNQWSDDGNNLVKIAKDLGCRTYGVLVWEVFGTNINKYKDYDRIIAPTLSFMKFLRQHRYRKFTYIPYSLNMNEFKNTASVRDTRFTFFHAGGFGGVHARKNTQKVIDAFVRLNDPNTKLIITLQKKIELSGAFPENIQLINENLNRQQLLDLYLQSDVVVLPSKWETIGIPILESIASGVPVITNNVPPMNEFIKEGLNGYLLKPTMNYYKGISIAAAEVDEIDLSNKMKTSMNKMLLEILKKNSKKIAEGNYDIEKNKHFMIEFLKEDLK